MNDEFGNPIAVQADDASGADEFGNPIVVRAAPKETEGNLFQRFGKAVKRTAQSMFPRTSAEISGALENGNTEPNDPLALAKDVASGIGTAISHVPGMETLSNADAWAQKKIAGPDQDYPLQNSVFQPAIDRLQELGAPGTAGTLEAIGKGASRPSTWITGLSDIPYFSALAKGGKVEKAVTAAESGLTGKSMEALTQGSTGPGRQALHAAAVGQGQAARNLEEVATNAKAFMPEEQKINEALAQAPDIDIRPTLKAFDKAMPQLTGEMGAATPGQLALRNKLQAYKGALQGSLPDEKSIADMDFGGNLDAARAALADPQSIWGVLNEISRKAAAATERAQGKASSAAGRVQEAQTAFETAPEKVIRYEGFPQQGYMQNSDLPGLLQANRLAEKVAKEAYANAQAKAAVGTVTAQDAARAKSELDAATHNLHVADAANEVSQGKPLEDVARGLVDRYGLEGNQLSQVLNKGRQFVANNSFTPAAISPKVSALDFKRLREALDKDIDFNDPGYQSLKGALKIPRTQMKDALIGAAGPEYAQNMRDWSQKIDDFNELNNRLGKAPSLRLNRADLLLKNSHREGNADLLSRIDQHTGRGFAEQGRLMRLAEEFTDKAKGGNVLNPEKAGMPSWRPRGGMPFASMTAGGIGSMLHAIGLPPELIAALDAAAVASTTPAFAAKVAIPAARHLPLMLTKASQAAPMANLPSSLLEALQAQSAPSDTVHPILGRLGR